MGLSEIVIILRLAIKAQKLTTSVFMGVPRELCAWEGEAVHLGRVGKGLRDEQVGRES